MKLDIGAGATRRDEDYTTVDAFHPAADLKAMMWELPFPDGVVTDIWCDHALEHVPMTRVAGTLREFFRVLKLGGRAIISVPNFDYVARYWLTGPDRAWAEQMVFGNQEHSGEFHQCAFTAELLKGDCEAAGFKVPFVVIRWTHNQETLQATCEKPT